MFKEEELDENRAEKACVGTKRQTPPGTKGVAHTCAVSSSIFTCNFSEMALRELRGSPCASSTSFRCYTPKKKKKKFPCTAIKKKITFRVSPASKNPESAIKHHVTTASCQAHVRGRSFFLWDPWGNITRCARYY